MAQHELEGVSEEIREIAWKAQHRLHTRYRKLMAPGKEKEKVVTAVGRELLGFIWAIGIKAEAVQKKTERRAASAESLVQQAFPRRQRG